MIDGLFCSISSALSSLYTLEAVNVVRHTSKRNKICPWLLLSLLYVRLGDVDIP